MSDILRMAYDVRSATDKIVIIDEKDNMLFNRYERHYSEVLDTVKKLVEEAYSTIGKNNVSAMITGSGGVSISDAVDITFKQEVV